MFFHMPLDTRIEIATTRDAGDALVQAIEHAVELAGRTFNLGSVSGLEDAPCGFDTPVL